ncbi:Kelch repeat-containing protein [Engelhardtia mirabilis]|uniref:N-acetylneuraminate epimerase n=1 Tax=Engelhardtia mirabilis TaxID=2528011 RepID=A0A518BQ53_9BACT|nr:N-acetylneuraminate epimerase [Planctomycetes bacterium Pla133]QDV03433.1 N-acetylneuraminate epimerase [Planctomycetes bacterium Pla86]
MRFPLSHAALGCASVTLLAGAALAAPQAQLTRTQGILGGSVDFDLSGANSGQFFFLMPSFQTGPLPLALIDPVDTRLLGIGLDLQSVWTFGVIDPLGNASTNYLLPPDPALQGLELFTQAITLPGTTTLVDDVTNRTAFALSAPGNATLTVGDLPAALSGHTATTLPDGRVLLAGGGGVDSFGATVPGNLLYLFDPQDQGFTTSSAVMSTERAAHTATLLGDGRVLLLGGSDAAAAPLASGEIYDPVTNTLSPIANMPTPRLLHTATLLNDGRVFVAGGASGFDLADPLAGLNNVLNSTIVYNPVANNWSAGPNFPNPRGGHRATKLNDGRVLLTGGLEVTQVIFIGAVPSITADCRIYNPANNSMSGAASFSGARALHAQVTLPDGRVFVAGGGTIDFLSLGISTLNSARVYDPGSNTWANVTSLAQPRAYAEAFAVAGNRVCVAGGLAAVDAATSSGVPANLVETSAITFGGWSTAPMVMPRVIPAIASIEDGLRLSITGAPYDSVSGGTLLDFSAETFLP